MGIATSAMVMVIAALLVGCGCERCEQARDTVNRNSDIKSRVHVISRSRVQVASRLYGLRSTVLTRFHHHVLCIHGCLTKRARVIRHLSMDEGF